MKTSLSPLQKPTHLMHYFFARHSVDCKLFSEGVNISQTRTNPLANKSLQKELANLTQKVEQIFKNALMLGTL